MVPNTTQIPQKATSTVHHQAAPLRADLAGKRQGSRELVSFGARILGEGYQEKPGTRGIVGIAEIGVRVRVWLGLKAGSEGLLWVGTGIEAGPVIQPRE